MTEQKKTKTGGNEIVKKNKADVLAVPDGLEDFYKDDTTDVFDITIPRILVMQGQSGMVNYEKAVIGEIRENLNCDLLAAKGKSFEIIPLKRFKSFKLFRPNPEGGKPTFVKELPYNRDTIQWEKKRLREVEIDGENLQCFIAFNFFILPVADIDEALPMLISFSSTAFKTAKDWNTQIVQAASAGYKLLPQKTYNLSASKRDNEKGNWYIPTIGKGRVTSEDEMKEVAKWLPLLADAKISDEYVDEYADESVADAPIKAGEVSKDQEY